MRHTRLSAKAALSSGTLLHAPKEWSRKPTPPHLLVQGHIFLPSTVICVCVSKPCVRLRSRLRAARNLTACGKAPRGTKESADSVLTSLQFSFGIAFQINGYGELAKSLGKPLLIIGARAKRWTTATFRETTFVNHIDLIGTPLLTCYATAMLAPNLRLFGHSSDLLIHNRGSVPLASYSSESCTIGSVCSGTACI